jgi:hypothetical protein
MIFFALTSFHQTSAFDFNERYRYHIQEIFPLWRLRPQIFFTNSIKFTCRDDIYSA